MDRMDRYLMQLPHRMPDNDFHRRIVQHVWRRRRRLRRIRAGISAVLSGVGLWLVMPTILGWVTSTPVPDNSLPWLIQIMDIFLQDFQGRLMISVDNLFVYQNQVASTISASAFLGMLVIAFALLLVMDQVMPRMEV